MSFYNSGNNDGRVKQKCGTSNIWHSAGSFTLQSIASNLMYPLVGLQKLDSVCEVTATKNIEWPILFTTDPEYLSPFKKIHFGVV